MKCFSHSTADAVGICASCGRGVCPECATPLEIGRLACSSTCGAKLKDYEQRYIDNKQEQMVANKLQANVLAQAAKTYKSNALVCWGFALMMAIPAIPLHLKLGAWPLTFLLISGSVLFAYCAVISQRLAKEQSESKSG